MCDIIKCCDDILNKKNLRRKCRVISVDMRGYTMKNKYQNTVYACFVGYIVQAIVNNFVPLLFLTFEKSYNIPLSKITMLITFNFGIQLVIDLLSAKFVDRIGYRIAIVLAHVFSAAGLISLVILPDVLPDAFTGIFISVVIYAVGGGLIEVLISPIVESCPSDNKEKAMSLLHSFYCWGHVARKFQQGIIGSAKWRNVTFCIAGACGGCGLLRRTDSGGLCVKSGIGRPETRNPCGSYIPDVFARGDTSSAQEEH